MTKQVRRIGFLMIVAGVLTIVIYVFPPFQLIRLWVSTLPIPIQVGLSVAAVGLVILMISLLWERWTDREVDRALRDD